MPESGSSITNRPLLALSAGLAMLAGAIPAHAFNFGDKDGLSGSLDTTVSYGVAYRAGDRDASLVGGPGRTALPTKVGNGGQASTSNGDDGNLNYDQGDPFSSMLKATHELDLNYRNFGFFGRAFYFYDFSNAERAELGSHATERVGRDLKLLDAYVRGTFELGDKNLQIRLGNQVVSWGESTFVPNGINVINAVDVSRLRTPGSEIKEALLPTPMAWLSQEISRNVSLEAFATARFKKTRIDPRGSYFSNNDTASDDGDRLYLRDDQHQTATQWLMRGKDREAQNGGEYGLALRIHAPQLNETEFGLFYANYHHRTPVVSATRGGVNVLGVPVPLNALPPNAPVAKAATYFVEYPEDVDLYGASFNTAGPSGIALQGEYSYRPNLPLQLASGELVNAALGLPNSITGGLAAAQGVAMGTEISGYRRVRMHQIQVSATKAFPAVLKADQVVLLGEVGYTYLDLPDGVRFAGYGETTPAGSFGAPFNAADAGRGFATRSSWGYQLRASAEYNNAIGAIRLTPSFAFSHSVNGVSPTWNEGVRSYTLGLGASYREQWKADLAYTAFFGGKKLHPTPSASNVLPSLINTNGLEDRDFVSASISYSF